jgi:hypothetical protein
MDGYIHTYTYYLFYVGIRVLDNDDLICFSVEANKKEARDIYIISSLTLMTLTMTEGVILKSLQFAVDVHKSDKIAYKLQIACQHATVSSVSYLGVTVLGTRNMV